MSFVSRGTPGSPVSPGERGVRRAAPEDYFKSREVYRSERGFILVDAFRFVDHAAAYSADVGASPHAERQAAKMSNRNTQRRSGPHKFYFLSHFHSDHYTGIQHSWHTDTIYCSRSTAALTQSELGVPSACLFPMKMNETYVFSLRTGACLACVPETPLHPRVQTMLRRSAPSSASAAVNDSQRKVEEEEEEDMFAVRLIPANHCPGAAILLFASPLFGTVIHTGDFRFNGSQRHWRDGIRSPSRRTYVSLPQIQQQVRRSSLSSSALADVLPVPSYVQFVEDDAALREVAAKAALDVLFLDNTFCDPPYEFPTQWEATQTVVEVLRSLFDRTAGRKREAQAAAVAAAATSVCASQDRHNERPPSPPQQRRPACVRCAVLIGCYTIGKERVALAIRDAFPCAQDTLVVNEEEKTEEEKKTWRVYVSPRRHWMLTTMNFFPDAFQPLQASATCSSSLQKDGNTVEVDGGAPFAHVEDTPVQLPVLLHSARVQQIWEEAQAGGTDVRRDLSADFCAGLSDSPNSSCQSESPQEEAQYLLSVFLVSMANVGYQSVAALARAGGSASLQLDDSNLKLNLAPYDCVLMVEPTGWCKQCARRDVNDKLTLLKVPYSEHCGFREMLRFVQFVNPARVVPTVSEDNFKKHEALFVEKAPRLRSRVSNVQPITRFFTAVPLRGNINNHRHHSSVSLTKREIRTVKQETKEGLMATSPRSGVGVTNRRAVVAQTTVSAAEQPSNSSLSENQADAHVAMPVTEQDPDRQVHHINFKSALNIERKRAPHRGGDRPVPAAAISASASSTTAQALDRLFQRVKTDVVYRATQTVSTVTVQEDTALCKERNATADEGDEDCQLVRVVQTVVEISDDD